jgi:hypothetical protein
MTDSTKHGRFIVIRDSKGRVITKALEGRTTKETFRALLQRMSGNGADYIMELDAIARGAPLVVRLPDGRESEPQVVPVGVRVEVLKFLVEQMHGKAVEQTKVMEATKAGEESTNYDALTEAQLEQRYFDNQKRIAMLESDAELVEDTPDESG